MWSVTNCFLWLLIISFAKKMKSYLASCASQNCFCFSVGINYLSQKPASSQKDLFKVLQCAIPSSSACYQLSDIPQDGVGSWSQANLIFLTALSWLWEKSHHSWWGQKQTCQISKMPVFSVMWQVHIFSMYTARYASSMFMLEQTCNHAEMKRVCNPQVHTWTSHWAKKKKKRYILLNTPLLSWRSWHFLSLWYLLENL